MHYYDAFFVLDFFFKSAPSRPPPNPTGEGLDKSAAAGLLLTAETGPGRAAAVAFLSDL